MHEQAYCTTHKERMIFNVEVDGRSGTIPFPELLRIWLGNPLIGVGGHLICVNTKCILRVNYK